MLASTPRLAISKLLAAMRALDAEAMLSLYEEDATVVILPGMLGQGKTAIRSFFENIFALKPEIQHGTDTFTEAGDLALFTAKWTIVTPIPANLLLNKTNYHSAILRKQPDGHWLIAVDNPWGPDPPPKGAGPTVL
jgi:uncharacterized protein (TIGR02246 family)